MLSVQQEQAKRFRLERYELSYEMLLPAIVHLYYCFSRDSTPQHRQAGLKASSWPREGRNLFSNLLKPG